LKLPYLFWFPLNQKNENVIFKDVVTWTKKDIIFAEIKTKSCFILQLEHTKQNCYILKLYFRMCNQI